MTSAWQKTVSLPVATPKRAAPRYSGNKEFTVSVGLGLGDGSATVYTSDLSHEYVSINADYRS